MSREYCITLNRLAYSCNRCIEVQVIINIQMSRLTHDTSNYVYTVNRLNQSTPKLYTNNVKLRCSEREHQGNRESSAFSPYSVRLVTLEGVVKGPGLRESVGVTSTGIYSRRESLRRLSSLASPRLAAGFTRLTLTRILI